MVPVPIQGQERERKRRRGSAPVASAFHALARAGGATTAVAMEFGIGCPGPALHRSCFQELPANLGSCVSKSKKAGVASGTVSSLSCRTLVIAVRLGAGGLPSSLQEGRRKIWSQPSLVVYHLVNNFPRVALPMRWWSDSGCQGCLPHFQHRPEKNLPAPPARTPPSHH